MIDIQVLNRSSNSILRRYDFSFFLLAGFIFALGLLNLYSVNHSVTVGPLFNLYKKQLIWYLFSLCVGVVISFVRPKTYQRVSYPLYFFNCFLLALVLIIGVKVFGARRWLNLGLFRFQPSEMMKIAIVFVLAKWYSEKNPLEELDLKTIIFPFLISFFPAFLIIIEPDLGTGLVIILIFLTMTFYRRLKIKSIMILTLIAIITGSVMYQFGLKEYQKQRIITFLDPWGDARGHGYNAIQSEIAIGSGQLTGKGFMKSSQASLNYLPENHSDFVFSVFNEEHGMLGAMFLILLYILFFMRFIWLATVVADFYDAVLAMGLMAIIFWHTFINMGMVTGLLPIVGLPLPFFSYGGSSLLTFNICCGIATSLSNSRNIFS